MGRRSYTDIITSAGIIIVVFYFIYRYYAQVNIDSSVGETLFVLLPGFVVVAISIYVTAESRGVGKMGGTLGTGMGLCYLLYSANSENLITARMLSGLTIPQLQIWIMIIATVTGSIIYATA